MSDTDEGILNDVVKLPAESVTIGPDVSMLTSRLQFFIPIAARDIGNGMKPHFVFDTPRISEPNCGFGRKPLMSRGESLPQLRGLRG